MIRRGEARRRAIREGTREFLYGQCLREALLDARAAGSPCWNIISLVREPVGRNVSAFFQNLDVYLGSQDIGSVDIDLLIRVFMRDFDHDRPLDWFDAEIKAITGIDVLCEGFDYERGYQIYKHEPFRLLVLRMDDIRTSGTIALKEFVGLDVGEIGNENTGDSKGYSEVYKAMRDNLAFDETYLERMYGSSYAKTFYAESELEAFRRRWRRQAISSKVGQ